MQTFAGQAGPKFKTVCQMYERIICEILKRSGYFRFCVCTKYTKPMQLQLIEKAWGS